VILDALQISSANVDHFEFAAAVNPSHALLFFSFPHHVSPAAPVHQMKEYYTYGTVDDCTGHWGKLTDCLKRKTEKYKEEAAIDPNAAKHPLWQLRTGLEAKEFWRQEFNSNNNSSTSTSNSSTTKGYGSKSSISSTAAKGGTSDRPTMI
jgi:hypothetical protein